MDHISKATNTEYIKVAARLNSLNHLLFVDMVNLIKNS